jgi:hypothetical protein
MPNQDANAIRRWRLRHDTLGHPYRAWEPSIMARIKDELLRCAAYIYPSRKDAEEGNKCGGSGFFVGIDWSANPNRRHVYAVTNKHVIETCFGNVVIRATTLNGKLEFIECDPAEWYPSPMHDVSVLPIEPSKAALFQI